MLSHYSQQILLCMPYQIGVESLSQVHESIQREDDEVINNVYSQLFPARQHTMDTVLRCIQIDFFVPNLDGIRVISRRCPSHGGNP